MAKHARVAHIAASELEVGIANTGCPHREKGLAGGSCRPRPIRNESWATTIENESVHRATIRQVPSSLW